MPMKNRHEPVRASCSDCDEYWAIIARLESAYEAAKAIGADGTAQAFASMGAQAKADYETHAGLDARRSAEDGP